MQSLDEQEKEQLRESRNAQRQKHQRMRKLRRRLFLGVLAVIAVLAAVLIVRGCRKTPQPAAEIVLPENAEVQSEALPDGQNTVVRIAAVGDIMIGDDQLAAARQADGSYDFTSCFAPISAYTMAVDLTVGNLELNFCGEPYCGKPDFRAPEALAKTLSGIGFDVLQTANSFSIQNGLTGLRSTMDTLERWQISPLGTYRSEEEKSACGGVLLKNVNGMRIAMLGFTKGLNNLSLPENEEYAVDLLYEDYATDYTVIAEDAIVRSVENAKALSPDLTIAMLHWGSEFDRGVTAKQEKIASLLLENGVDVILGSHSHMAGKLEQRTVTRSDGTERNCVIAYSLGNFYADQTQAHTMQSMLLNLTATKNGATGETTLTDVSYTPICTVKQDREHPTFEVLPIRAAIRSGQFEDFRQTLTDAIADLRTATESDLDSGE